MKTILLIALALAMSATLNASIYDAQDGGTTGWTKIRGSIANVADPDDNTNRAIRIDGLSVYGRYWRGGETLADGDGATSLSVDILAHASFTFRVQVDTNIGKKYITLFPSYNPGSIKQGYGGSIMMTLDRRALGAWNTYELDLQDIFDSVNSNAIVTGVEGIMVLANNGALLDNIHLSGTSGIDTTPPIITLNGDAHITLDAGSSYLDPGATAIDDVDGDISSRISVSGNVDTTTPGSYQITYNVSDAAGNAAEEAVRTVQIIQPVENYGAMGSHEVSTYIEHDQHTSTVYYPSDISTQHPTPLVFFCPGWQSQNPSDYDTLLRFIASHGYSVIYAKDYYGDTATFIRRFEKMLDGSNDVLPYVDTTRIGVIGHSSGGGDTFKILDHFSRKGYGNNARFLMALDPWFAFDMTSDAMRNLPTNTHLIIQRYDNEERTGNDTDARIVLSEYALTSSIPEEHKDYQVFTPANHGYPSGSRDPGTMQGLLAPLGALMAYTFEGNENAHDPALENGSDQPFSDNVETVRPIWTYAYRCNTHVNRAEIMDIDYCNEYNQPKHYPDDTVFDSKPIGDVAKPDYLGSYTDPIFGNTVTRITDRANQTGNAQPYSKTGAWNSDMSLIRLGYRLYDANTFAELQTTRNQLIRGSMTEMKWSTIKPDVFYGIDSRSDAFVFVKATINRSQNQITYEAIPNATFPKSEYDELLLGKYEGNLDYQSRYVVFSGRKKGSNRITLIVFHLHDNYNTTFNEIVAQKTFDDLKWYKEDANGNFDPDDSSQSNQMLDWASISAKGNYVLVNYHSKPGDPEQEYSIEQYDRHLNHIRRLAEHGDHGDLGLTAEGNEVYVQFGFGTLNGASNRGIWLYPLDGSPRVRLLPDKYNGGHVSCRNYKRPGWCYLNTRYSWNGSTLREAFALKLDGSGTVERFAQTHNSVQNAGSVLVNASPDGTRVLFGSDWNDPNGVVDTYHVQVPDQ